MKAMFVCGALLAVSACTVVPTTGEGNFDGVALDAQDTQSCTNVPIEAASGATNARERLLRCGPQSQPIVGN